ncbi:hypothetical protein [Roseobacter sp. OBYS 0001]|uniref:hypothetical protein n=1 Tax=Roseobacter sp. OBYS 0001 TaxID=882651 RepID=UPI001BC699BB|nr:hypothetical protein [Roseobacter sp. OBYS 0001]GIT88958.1 hypothetical protein ROBYS_39740 [Roseobacter sp. OBYS 0001]
MTADKIRSLLMPGSEPTLKSREGGYIGGPREFFELEAMTMVTEHGARKPRSYSPPGLQMPFFLEKTLRRLEISCSKRTRDKL